MQWENSRFSKRNLELGEELNQKGAVKEVERIGDTLRAIVEDRGTHNVEITLNGTAIEDFVCDCKSYDYSYNCQHVVAVLENWFEEQKHNNHYGFTNPLDNPFEKVENNQEQIFNFVKNTNNSYKDKFLADFLIKNKELLTEYLINSENRLTEPEMFLIAQYLEELCIRFCQDKKRVWMRERDLAYDLEEFLQKVIKPLSKRGNQLNAFALAAYMFEIINEYELSETTDGVTELENNLVSFMNSYLNDIPDEEVNEVFKWFLKNFPCAKDSIIGEFEKSTFINNFNQESQIKDKLAVLDELLAKGGNNNEEYIIREPFYSKGSTINDLVSAYFTIALNSENAEEIINELVQNYPNSLDIQRNYFEFLLDNQNYDKALNVVNDILSKTENKPILKEYYLNERKKLSSKLNNSDDEISNLEELALYYDNNDFEYASELQNKLSDNEWEEFKQKLKDQYKNSENEADFLNYIQDYEALLNLVSTKNDFDSFLKYFDVLSAQFPQEILNVYANFLDVKVSLGKNREAYQKIVEHLEKMEKLDSGKEFVKDLIKKWRAKYFNRRALLDELDKFELKS